MRGDLRGRSRAILGILTILLLAAAHAEAGGRFFPRGQVAPSTVPSVPRVRVVAPTSAEPLGTFAATPYIMVRGNGPTGGGYSPLGQFGDTTLSLYGPLSSLRSTAAPVLTYSRGYDGRTRIVPGTSFSTPNLPALRPVVYPTQATYYYGFRQTGNPPWWVNGGDWIDQN